MKASEAAQWGLLIAGAFDEEGDTENGDLMRETMTLLESKQGALEKYGDHTTFCKTQWPWKSGDCTCGFSKVLVAQKNEHKEIAALIERLDGALEWYAAGQHFHCDGWDTVSGEPTNWLHDVDHDDKVAMVEDGYIARKALEQTDESK